MRPECSVDGCDKQSERREFCMLHYRRLWRTRSAGEAGRRRSRNGTGWYVQGYKYISVGGKKRREHHVVMEGVLGRPLASHETVHHRNGVRDDNHPENLELWAQPQPTGQRVSDLVEWTVRCYRPMVEQILARDSSLEVTEKSGSS